MFEQYLPHAVFHQLTFFLPYFPIRLGPQSDAAYVVTLQILKKIWTDDVVEFKGQFYNIPASKVGPKPIQKPHIPIYLGGYSQSTFVRIANYANGWICVIRDSLDEAK
jgi:alkanesulfonate monooxygenase SsuD/methylene tetrahydromethanopterin reductase-like flavin-dependent oxidoreductase (luciferase family)